MHYRVIIKVLMIFDYDFVFAFDIQETLKWSISDNSLKDSIESVYVKIFSLSLDLKVLVSSTIFFFIPLKSAACCYIRLTF